MAPTWRKMAPRRAKLVPRWPHGGPRLPHDGPRWSNSPKRYQDVLRCPQNSSIWPQDGPTMVKILWNAQHYCIIYVGLSLQQCWFQCRSTWPRPWCRPLPNKWTLNEEQAIIKCRFWFAGRSRCKCRPIELQFYS